MSTTREELLACPFCGPGNSIVECYQDDIGYWKVGCGACGSHSGIRPKSDPEGRAKVIASWNRTPDRLAATPKAGVDREAWEIDATRKDIVRAIEAWRANQLTTYTPSNILFDFGDEIIAALALPSVLGGVDQKETQTTKPSPSSAAATATETALERIVRAWDLIVSGQPAAASEFVPQYVADNWAASFATFACDELRKATQCNEQSGKQLSPAWQPIDTAPRNRRIMYHNGKTTDAIIGYCRWSVFPDDDLECWWDYERDYEACPKFWMEEIPLPLPKADVAPVNAGLVSGGGR